MPHDAGALRLSPSSIMTFLHEPALYVLRRRFGVQAEAGPGAWLGDAVHHGVAYALLHGADHDRAHEAALAKFHERSGGEIRADIDEARERIAPCLRQAMAALAPYGKPVTIEGWVEAPIPGVDAVVRGRTDFGYDDYCIDLKTGRNCYVRPLPDHVLQLACYWRATALPQKLCYVTHARTSIVEVTEEDLAAGWRQIVAAARAMVRLESLPDGDAVTLYPPRDLTGYRWDDATRAKAREIWNLHE
jgi:hypothetical protein